MDMLAYVLDTWRELSFYLGLIGAPSLLCFLLLPESPRWLLSKGRQGEAEEILTKMNQFKSATKIRVQHESPKSTDIVTYTYWHLVSNCKVLVVTSSMVCIWSVLPVMYYTIGAQSLNYGGNMYVNYMLASLPDIPAAFLAIYSMNRLGRKKTTLASCCGCGLFIGAVALVPLSMEYGRATVLTLTVLSKLCCSVAFSGIFLWTPEVFPTVLRAQAMAICGMFEKLSMIAVPFVCTFLQTVSFSLPFILMCILGVLGSLAGITLPETKNRPTMDLYQDFVSRSTPSSNPEIGLDNVGSPSE